MAAPSDMNVFRDRFNDPKKRAELEEEMRREQVESSLAQTADVNPDQAARDNALANQFDVDPGFVEQHRPDYEAAAQREDMNLEQVAKDAPITHERLGDPAFAQLASDDVGVLATIEGMGRETVQSFQRGVVNTKRSLLGGREAFGEAIGLGTGDRYFYDMYQYDQQLAELNVDYGAPESGAAGQLTNLASFTAEMAPLVSGGMVASGLGYAAAGLLTAAGVAVSAPAVGGLAGALYIYSTMTGEVYTGLESIEVGEDQEINRQAGAWVSMAAAVPMAALERLGFSKIPVVKRIVGAADESAASAFLRQAATNKSFQQFVTQRAVGQAAVAATTEAVTEIGQQAIQIAATEAFAQFQDGTYKDVRYTPTNALGRPLIDPETGEPLVIFDAAGVLAQLIDAGKAGFYGGGGMAIGGAAINVATESQAADKLRAKVGMLEQASASRLRERDKPTFQKHIRDLIAKGSAPEYIYVDRTKANELAQDESEEDGSPNEEWQSLTENVPSLAGADQASEETGAEIAIPYDEWVTYVAGTSAGDSLAMDSRESLEDFTPRQLQEQADKTAEEAARFSEEEFAELTDDDAVLEAIEQKIEAGILQEPRLGQVEAKRYAQFIAGRVRVRAERNNQTVRELVAESGIVQVIPSRQLEAGPEGPVALRASLESLIARAEQKGRLQRYRREDGVRPNIRERRMLRALAEEGGVEPNSDMGQMLRALDVPETGKGSIRGLFQEGGLSNVDQIIPSEMENRDSTRLSNIFSDPSLQGEDGFVDPNKVFEAIAQENRGDPFLSGDESIAFGEEQQEFERVQAALEKAGLTLDDDTEALLDLLSPLDDEMSLERDGDGEFYQGSLLPPGLKSVLLEVATTLPKKGTAAEYRAALEKQAQKGNIKNDELQFSGLLEFLTMSEGLEDGMSRRDIVEFLQEGGLQVAVKMLGGEASEATNLSSRAATDIFMQVEPHYIGGPYGEVRVSAIDGLQREDLPQSPLFVEASNMYESSIMYSNEIDQNVWSTRPGSDPADIQATLTQLLENSNLNQPLEESGVAETFRSRFVAEHPNGRRYIDPGMARDQDELLILMLLSRTTFADEYFAALDASVEQGPGGTQLEGSTLFGEYIKEAGSGYMEILVTVPKRADETREEFTAGHWGSEPSDVVVSLLAEPRDGKLYIFEIQSDWHQRGRKKGYLTAETAKELDAARLKSSDANRVRVREMARVKADIRAKFLAAGLSAELDDQPATLDALAAAGGTIKVPIDDKKIAVIVEMREGFGAHIEFLNADGSPRGMGVEKLPFDFRNAHRAVNSAVNELTNRDQDVMSAIMLYKSAVDEVAKLRDKVPEAPFSKTEAWTDLGLKNALLQAHAMGLSGVVMTDAQMIDDRWADEEVTKYYATKVPKQMKKLAKKYGGEIEPLEEWDGIGAQGAINFTPELIDAIESDSIELFQSGASEKVAATPGIQNVLKYLNPDEARKLKANTAQRLIDLIDELPEPGELASVAFAGRAKRGWYLDSAKAILDVFGLEDSRRFTGLLAATSPQTGVESNLINTLAIWNAWVSAGRPVDKAQILAVMGESVQGDKGEDSVLDAWRNNSFRILTAENPTTVILSGPKVNSFMLNLRGVVDEVTNDTWMANIMGVQQTMFAGSITKTDPGKGPGYMAANVVTRRAAEILSQRTGLDWTPAEIQETIWSWARTLGQLGEVKGETRSLIQILTDGELTDERIADTPDFAILFSQGVYRTLLKEGGYEEELQGLERAARDNRPDGAGARGEAGQTPGVAEGRYRGDLRRAARRLERTRQERREGKGELGQPEEFADGRRGAMGPVDELERGELGNAYIRLLGASNRSTFLHEASHLFLFELLADSAREGAPQQLRDDVAILRQALGMTPDQAFSTEQHELFASMAEAYFFEGNAPTRELQPMFDQFREWMLRIYRSVQRIFGYDVPLSDEVRGVLDRMLATDQEIAFARAQRGMDQVLRDSDQNMLGLTDDEREEYVEIERKGRRAQTESIEKAARAVEKRRQSEKYRARKAALREEVEQEVNARPAMRLRMWLQHGKLPDGTEPNVPPGKMDRNALRNIAGNGILKVLPSGRYGYWTRSGGVHPDVLRVEFGFETVNQMLEQLALMVKKHPQDIINRETEKQMLEQYGEYSTEEQIDAAVAKAIDQKDAIDQLVFEERMMAKRSGGQVSPTQMLRQIARRIVSSTRLPELKPGRFSKQAEQAAMRALEALQSGDLAAAQEAKRQQRLAILMESEARKALDQVERHLRHVAKLKTKAGRERVAVPGTKHGNALGYLLDKFDFRRSVGNRPPTGDAEGAAALIEFINEETALGYEPLVSPAQAIETGRRHYRSLTYDEFMEVIEGIRSIEASARRENKIHLRDKAQDREAVALELRQRSQETRHIKRPKMIDKELPAEERTRAMQAIYFATRSINSIIYQLDGGPVGPWRNYLWEPIVQAVNKREEMSEAYLSELSELLKQHVGNRDAEYRERKFNVYGMEASRYGLISMALNLGTESNTSKLIEGYQGQGLAWSEGKIKAYLDQNLSHEDWFLVQSLWDLTNKLWPTISADAVATYGIEPEKVEGRTLSTPYGEVTGQYFPVVYDPDKLDSVHRTQDKGVWEGSETSFRRPLTDSGYRVSRTGFRGPILLDLEVLPRHLDKVIHDLALHNVLNEVDRLIDSDHVKAAIKEAHGLEAFRLFRPWLMAIAKDAVDPNPPTASPVEHLAREARTGLSVFYLAWNTMTVMMQNLGHLNTHAMLIQNMGINNARKYHGLGVRTVLGSPKESRDRAFEMSGVMRRRVAAGERDRKDALRRLSGKGGREADATMLGLEMIGLMQTYGVDLPSWWAAFYAAKDGALSADTGPMTDIQAVAAADAIVNLTQGGGDVQDLAAVMRGNNVNRMFTAFHSYMITLFSHLSLIASQGGVGGRQKKDVNRSRAMAAYVLVMILSPTLENFMRNAFRDDDDDEDEDKNFIRTVVASHLAQYPGFIPGVSSQKNLIANLIDDGDRFIGSGTSIDRMIQYVAEPLEKSLEMLSGEEETTASDVGRAALIARTLLLKKGVTNGMLKLYDAAYELIAGEDE